MDFGAITAYLMCRLPKSLVLLFSLNDSYTLFLQENRTKGH